MSLKPGTRLTFEWQDAQNEDWNCRPVTAADLLDALDFPSDEDVEAVFRNRHEQTVRWDMTFEKIRREMAAIRSELQAVADARRTEEEEWT